MVHTQSDHDAREQAQDGMGDTTENKWLALLSYFSLFSIVPFVLKKDNTFLAFHAKQGVVLCGLEILLCGVRFVPALGEVIFVFGMIVCAVCSLAGMIKMVFGRKWEIPVIYDIAEKINW